MKCDKCGYENVNNSVFCGSCGNKLIVNVEQNNNGNLSNTKSQTPASMDKKKVFIILGIVIGIIILAIVINGIRKKSNSFKDPFEDVEEFVTDEEKISTKKGLGEVNYFTKALEDDYNSGKLSKDEYIMQLAYSIYDKSKLNSKYKSAKLDFNSPSIFFEKANSLSNALSDDTKKYVVEKYLLSDVKWEFAENSSVDGSNTSTFSNQFDHRIDKLINTDNDVNKLDNIKLSSNGHFLLYYTTSGVNAVKESDVDKIAAYLEEVVVKYKEKYGLDFKYESKINLSISDMSILNSNFMKKPSDLVKKILKNRNIDIKYYDTAMPVYLLNTEGTGALGYYVAPFNELMKEAVRLYDLFLDGGQQLDSSISTYAFPYFVVSSSIKDYDDLKIVASHELFHHYQKYICGDGEYKMCSSGNFTEETTADFAAMQISDVNKLGTELNEHASYYTDDVELNIDKIGFKLGAGAGIGYGAFIFANNYANIVDNGYKYLFDSMKTNELLKYLYDNSGGKYKDVLLTTAEKNLTLDYDSKLLIANDDDGKIIYPRKHRNIGKDDVVQSNIIEYSSMHYYYIDPSNYSQKSQLKFFSDRKDLTVLLFVREGESYKYLYSTDLEKDFIINIDDFSYYDEVAFAIVNSSISEQRNYKCEVNNEGLYKATVNSELLKLKGKKDIIDSSSSFVCQLKEEDDTFNEYTQIKLSFDKKEKINEFYVKYFIQIKNYDPDDPTFELTQKLVSGMIQTIKLLYEEEFKYYQIITTEGKTKYSITFKVLKDYYNALSSGLDIEASNKYDIIREIESDGYKCKYLGKS